MQFLGKDIINSTNFISYGRYDILDNDLIYYYTASGFRCNLKGTINLEIEASNYSDDIKRPYITVFINKKPTRIGLFSEINNLTFDVDGLFELFKSTEGSQSIIKIKKVIINGSFLELTKKNKKALVFGDSYTCGFGSLSNNEEDPFITKEEDGMNTYAFLALYELGYDIEEVAISGHALYKSPYADKTIPEYYKEISDTNNKKFIPNDSKDLIVINLGTNDSIYFNEGHFDLIDEYGKAYLKFLDTLKKDYPNAKIVMIGYDIQKEVNNQIKKVKENTVYNDVYHLELVAHDKSIEGFGSLGHPKKITHERWSKVLKEFIGNI